jgi:hypothetical protein
MSSFQTGFGGGVGTAFPPAASFPHYAIQQGMPYNVYGYASPSLSLSLSPPLSLSLSLSLSHIFWDAACTCIANSCRPNPLN